MRLSAAAVSLALCVLVGAPAYADEIITIKASGNLGPSVTTGPASDADNFFGLGADLTGALAQFTWTIDIGSLGTPASSAGENDWIWEVPADSAFTLETNTSLVPLGITGSLTINGTTVSTGLSREVLVLQQDVSGADELLTYTNTNSTGTFPQRNWIDFLAQTFGGNFFIPSLDPADLAGLTLPACNTDNGDNISGDFRYKTSTPNTYANGAIDLCGANTTFSVTASAPEPMTIALFGAGLIGLGALRRRKERKAA